MKSGILHILVADRDPGDRRLYQRAIKKTGLDYRLYFVDSREDAIAWLHGSGPYVNRRRFPFPDIFIIDLAMPGKIGLEILAWMQSQEKCAVVPTIVLSASARPEDVRRCYRLGASTCFSKRNSVDEMTGLLSLVLDYWLIAQVP